MESTSKQFAMVPWDVLDDKSLSNEAVRAYAEIVRLTFDGVAVVPHTKLGKRIDRSRDTARRIIRQLLEAGHIAEIPILNGQRPKYRLTHSIHATGSAAESNANPLHPCHPTRSTDAIPPVAPMPPHTIRNSLDVFSKKSNVAQKKGLEPSDDLLEAIRQYGNVDQSYTEAQREARKAIRSAGVGKERERILIDALVYSGTADGSGITAPVAFAISCAKAGRVKKLTNRSTGYRASSKPLAIAS